MSKKLFSVHHISILSISEVIKFFVFSAYDSVHQQERHLWSIYEETRCLFATQRRGYIRQIHKHVTIPQIILQHFVFSSTFIIGDIRTNHQPNTILMISWKVPTQNRWKSWMGQQVRKHYLILKSLFTPYFLLKPMFDWSVIP